MISSSKNKDILLFIYRDKRTVFRLIDIAMLIGETDFNSLNKKLNYYARKEKIGNPRKGIYTKIPFDLEELACRVYTPSYISLEYVLQKAGVLFQYDPKITIVSYLSRGIEISGQTYLYRKIKGELLANTSGIIRQENHVNIATPERALLDLLYLNPGFYFDNLSSINKEKVYRLLPYYNSKPIRLSLNKAF